MNEPKCPDQPLRSRLPDQIQKTWPLVTWSDVHVLVGVSGGADSTALLRALCLLRGTSGAGKIYAAHVNHQLRAAESDAQQAWLQVLTQRMGVTLFVRRGEVVGPGFPSWDGWEAAARDVRYRLLAEMADEVGARYVALAHTRDDQVETVLFRLLRGTGLRGLGGMPAMRSLTEGATLVRPLLATSRAEVLEYLREIGQEYCHDSSNDELRFSRNRLRHELIPLLQTEYRSDVDLALWRLSEQAAQAHDLIEGLAKALWERARQAQPLPSSPPMGGGSLVLLALRSDVLTGVQPYLASEVWRLAWRDARLSEQAMTSAHWQQLAELSGSRGDGGSVNLPGGSVARRVRGWVVVQLLAP